MSKIKVPEELFVRFEFEDDEGGPYPIASTNVEGTGAEDGDIVAVYKLVSTHKLAVRHDLV